MFEKILETMIWKADRQYERRVLHHHRTPLGNSRMMKKGHPSSWSGLAPYLATLANGRP
jgi:hypothetical protein